MLAMDFVGDADTPVSMTL